MTRVNCYSYDLIGKENLKRTIVRRNYYKTFLNQFVKDHKDGSYVLLESPAESYFEANIQSVDYLLNEGFQGVYVSFQRPFNNVANSFVKQGIDLNKILIIDCATAFISEKKKKDPRCVNVRSDIEMDELVEIIHRSLQQLGDCKKFVFVDSLSTIALYKSYSDVLKLPKNLLETLKQSSCENVTMFFNIATELSKDALVESMSSYSNEFIHLGLCT
jgi:archaellum biogenesis ATPase FlaH